MELNIKRKNLPKKNDYFSHEPIERILLFVDSEEIGHRVKALDVLCQYLQNIYENGLRNDLEEDQSLKISITFAVLTRCEDVSPNVRAKALKVFYQVAELILKVLDETKDKGCLKIEPGVDISELELDVNGEHRFFWYCMRSFEERQKELMAVIRRRMDDDNVYVRKQAIAVLEKLIIIDNNFINKKNLKSLKSAFNDSQIPVKKQSMVSLTNIFAVYCHNSEIQDLWLQCILPLVYDPEDVVQSTALSLLEKQFLPGECLSIPLLKRLTSGYFLIYHKFLKKAFSIWKLENKLKSLSITQLEKYVGSEWEACVWFYLSMYSPIPSTVSNLVLEQFEKFNMNGEYPVFMKYLTNIISHVFKNLSSDKSEVICRVVGNALNSFTVPIELIPMYVEVLFNIYKHYDTESKFVEFSTSIIKKCVKLLKEIESATSFPEPPSEELIAKYFSTMKEFCHHSPSNITPNVISVLKAFSACIKPSKTLSKILSPGLKAHAFAALGKICLQDEILAKDVLPIFAKQLLTSNYDVIRSNSVIIMIAMCKRYTSFADKYVPIISFCIKDKLYLIRYQSIVLIIYLLQEGYIKWRGPLFFCLLSSLVDENETIRELGQYSLSQLLDEKKRNLFSEHFVDSIFVFNFFIPPDNETQAQTVRDLERFSMPGDHRREDRMLLYIFLLESMDMKERAFLINNIKEVLMSVAESVYPLNETTECIVRDCFAILTCKEIRSFNLEQFENVEEADKNEFHKTETGARRIVIIDPIIPVIVSLRNVVADAGSDLMHDIILFLKEFLHDYKDSLRDILSIDKMLLSQLELEIKNDTQKEQLEKNKNKNKSVAPAESAQNDVVTLQGIQSQVQEVSAMMVGPEGEDQRESGALSQPTPKNPPHCKPVRQLQTSSPKAGPNSEKSNSREENFVRSTYNISSTSPADLAELQRLASTPRVVLTPVQLPLDANILNISAIESLDESMNVDESEGGVS